VRSGQRRRPGLAWSVESSRRQAVDGGLPGGDDAETETSNAPGPAPLPAQIERGVAESGRKRRERAAREAARRAEAREVYSDKSGLPCLRLSFAVYLDALGTSEAMTTLTNRTLRRSLALVEEANTFLHDSDWEADLQVFLTFSDSLALGVPVWDNATAGFGLGFILASVQMYQLKLALAGRFLRGGIALGELYADSDTIVGQALVHAVKIEEQVAVVPRVVLDDHCVAVALRDAGTDFDPRRSEWNADLLVDADGRVFVDYLAAAFVAPRRVARSVLTRHRTQLVKALRAHGEQPRGRRVCSSVKGFGPWSCATRGRSAR